MERQIGEIFQDGEVTLKVEKAVNNCEGCFYVNDTPPSCYDKDCTSFRLDKTSVIFVKQ